MKRWWVARRRRVQCMHGAPAGQSYVSGRLIDLGRRKMWTCRRELGGCDKRWIA